MRRVLALRTAGLVLLFVGAGAATAVSVAASRSAARANGQIAFDRPNPTNRNGSLVYIANPDGTRMRRLIAGDHCCPSWSHSGGLLAVTFGGKRIGTATVDANGRAFKRLPIRKANLNSGCGGAWSPNDRRLACESWNDNKPSLDGIYTFSSANGSDLKRVTSNPLGGHDEPGSYSPSGKQLVFGRFDKYGDGIGLFIVNANGSGLHRLTPKGVTLQDGNTGDWSPTGNEIVFSQHATASAPGSLWTIRADGTAMHQIKVKGLFCGSEVGCHGPRWSPDGKKIIFAANSGGGPSTIYTINADGTRLKEVAPGDDPRWGTHSPSH
jgi:Tol biopolymer transport system component